MTPLPIGDDAALKAGPCPLPIETAPFDRSSASPYAIQERAGGQLMAPRGFHADGVAIARINMASGFVLLRDPKRGIS
jgi:hypothetical protein